MDALFLCLEGMAKLLQKLVENYVLVIGREIYQSGTAVIVFQTEHQAVTVEKAKDELKSRKGILKQASFAVYSYRSQAA